MKMQEEWMKMANQMAQDTYEVVKKLSEVNMNITKKIFEQQSAVMNECLSSAQAGIEKLSDVESYDELQKAQSELLKACSEKMASSYENSVSLLSTAGEEIGEVVEANVKTAEANLKAAAEKVTK